MSRRWRHVPLACLVLLALALPSSAQVRPKAWPADADGIKAPPCTVFDPTTGITTFCSGTSPLPVSGGGAGLGTTTGTSTTGFGKQWFPSTITGTVASGQQMVGFFDGSDLNVAYLRRSTTCANCLQVAISSDGGVTGTFFSTSAIIGNSVSTALRVPSSPPRYLVSSIGGPLNIFQSASLASGWTTIAGLVADTFVINAFAANADGSTVLSYANPGATARVCRSTDNGITFAGCASFGGAAANGTITYAGGTTWLFTNDNAEVWRSTNDGVTFVLQVDLDGTNGRSIQCQSPTYAVCLASTTSGNVFRSTDSGATWPTIVLSGLGAVPGGLCHFGSGSVSNGLGVPPIGLATISQNIFSSFNAGVNWFPGQTNGSNWDGTGSPSLRSMDCLNGRGIATYSTTGGGVNVFAIYNPLTQPGGTLQSSAGGYSVAAPIQAGIILNAAPTVSAANTAAVVTLTNTSGSRICIRRIELFNTGAAGNFTLTVTDGATVVLNAGTLVFAAPPQPSLVREGAPLLCSQTSNNLIVNVGAGGAAAVSTTSVVADRYPN